MNDVLLHVGTEHPDLLWILLASLGTFAVGLGAGLFSERVRSWFRSDGEPAAE